MATNCTDCLGNNYCTSVNMARPSNCANFVSKQPEPLKKQWEPMSYGESMRAHRRAQHLALEKLGEIAGISRSLLCQYEHDQKNPSLANLEALADALGLSIDEYIGHKVRAAK